MNSEIQFLLYNLPDEDGKVQVIIKDETIWCAQNLLSISITLMRLLPWAIELIQ